MTTGEVLRLCTIPCGCYCIATQDKERMSMTSRVTVEHCPMHEAAPELLELAKKVHEIANCACEGGFVEWNDYMDARQLRMESAAIIAKAEGRDA